MAGRRLVDAVIAGIGLSAGKDLYDKMKKELVEGEPAPETAEQKKAREKAEAKARVEARLASERAAKERAASEARTAREIDSELAALKKRVVAKNKP
jgi:hypothetical protein